MAAESGRLELLHKIWDWAEEVLTPEDLNKFFNKYIWGRTIWYVAAEKDKLQLFQELWVLAKELLTPEELINNLISAKDFLGRTTCTWNQIKAN